jgi:hypothetical protein
MKLNKQLFVQGKIVTEEIDDGQVEEVVEVEFYLVEVCLDRTS